MSRPAQDGLVHDGGELRRVVPGKDRLAREACGEVPLDPGAPPVDLADRFTGWARAR